MRKLFIITLMVLLSVITMSNEVVKTVNKPAKKTVATYNVNKKELIREINLVNSILFNGKDVEAWNALMVGTISAETNMGQYKGKSKLGITQITKAGLGYINSRLNDDDKYVISLLGYDHTKVKLKDLEWDHRLAILYGSIYYKHKLNGIAPSTENAMAKAWKKHCNTYAGAGTVEGFLKKFNYHGKKTLDTFNESPMLVYVYDQDIENLS